MSSRPGREVFFIKPFRFTLDGDAVREMSRRNDRRDPARSSLISCRRQRVEGVDESRPGKVVHSRYRVPGRVFADDDRGEGSPPSLRPPPLLFHLHHLEWARITGIVCAGRCGNAVR